VRALPVRMPLELVASPGTLYRVGRSPSPFVWRRPRIALADSVDPHDGYRWDAPNADFATLYCATRPLGSLVETLAYYRRDADFAAMLHSATDDDEPDPEYDFAVARGWSPVRTSSGSSVKDALIPSTASSTSTIPAHMHSSLRNLQIISRGTASGTSTAAS
jgi:hypothetical protein